MKLDAIVSRDMDIISGELCFTGTLVPAQSLIDHLKAGDSLEEFLEGFPSVSREQAEAFWAFSLLPIAHLDSDCACHLKKE